MSIPRRHPSLRCGRPSPPCPHDADRIVIYWHGPKSAEFKGGTYMQTEVCPKCGARRDGFVRRFAFLGIAAKI